MWYTPKLHVANVIVKWPQVHHFGSGQTNFEIVAQLTFLILFLLPCASKLATYILDEEKESRGQPNPCIAASTSNLQHYATYIHSS